VSKVAFWTNGVYNMPHGNNNNYQNKDVPASR
jgi:hypothetical protein